MTMFEYISLPLTGYRKANKVRLATIYLLSPMLCYLCSLSASNYHRGKPLLYLVYSITTLDMAT